ncbi:MAG TPA: glycine cleavage system aminomethyltransferase GcvT [Clostridia bacterium]|nr:glycine cleavage system aminomethyltransferase GcvT [Clostridia bacterium]
MEELRKTPLYETHLRLGGRMVDFGGWALPVQYASIVEEHRAVRERAGLFDVSHMGEARVTGKDAFAYLQKILTNDIATMTPGRCRYSMMCYESGGTVDDVLVYKYADEEYLLVINAGNTAKDVAWFQKNVFGDVKVEDESPAWAQLALQGPRFMEVLNAAGVEGPLPEKNYTFVPETRVAGIPCMVSRTGYTGEDGVELYCKAKDGGALHAALMKAGEGVGLLPCGLGARDTLRFEAGMPLYGHEMNETVTPLEVGIGFAVKLNKEDFIGKQALLAPVTRARIGLRLTERGIMREHCDVYCEGKLVGHTTSGMPVPTLEGSWAMALVDIAYAEKDQFEVDVRGKKLKAARAAIPFYKRS